MIVANEFIDALLKRDFGFYGGVPCSFLTPLINRLMSRRDTIYFNATSEGEALAAATGAWVGGRKTVVMCQNSGLGNMVNPLTSLNRPFRIPTLLVVTWRGRPGEYDEPQHSQMGQITPGLLGVLDIPWAPFPETLTEIATRLDQAESYMAEHRLPFALIMKNGDIAPEKLDPPETPSRPGGKVERRATDKAVPSRAQVLQRFLNLVPDDAAVIVTTGKSGRELFTLRDRAQQLYLVGSMGYASAVGHGLALTTARPVFVLDGDGAALMHLGNMASIGSTMPSNLVHILLDNGVHDSTGGQKTLSTGVDFAGVAHACGYRYSVSCNDLDTFADILLSPSLEGGPTFVHVQIVPGSMAELGRPTISPDHVVRRLRDLIVDPA
jgi:phosphonopyruvate decarboxylase